MSLRDEIKQELNEESEYRQKPPRRWKLLGYSYLYFLVILSAVGISYMENLTVVGKNTATPVVLDDSSAFVQEIPYQSPVNLPPVDLAQVATPTPPLIEKGKELFRANCSSCHGDNGLGDGPSSVTLNPKPRNFHSLTGWTNGSKISQIYKTLQEGVPRTGMASFSYMPPIDRFALIHYVRSFATGQPVDTKEELQALESTYQLSKGSSIPGQIPVAKAVQYIEREAKPEVALVALLADRVDDPKEGSGAEVFNRVAADKNKILAGLICNNDSSLISMDRFVSSVSADPLHLGFKAEVNRLSDTEWSEMYQFLNELKTQRGRK